jgi:hypothetical protein
VFNEIVRVQREDRMTSKRKKSIQGPNETPSASTDATPKNDAPKLPGVPPINPAMQMYTQQLMTYLHSLGGAANGVTDQTALPTMINPSFFFPFTPQMAPNIGMPLPNMMQQNTNETSPTSHGNKTTQNQSDSPMNILYPQHRFWKIEFPNETAKQEIDGDSIDVNITMKIRGEEASQYVPERLYSSHKYVLQHEVIGEALVSKYPLVVAKLQVVDPISRQKIVNSMKGKKDDVVKGTPEAALTHEGTNGNNSVTGAMKIQFTDVSYRHEKGHFAMLINYYNPANLEEPLFNVISPAFKVFARKPTDKNPTETLKPNKSKPTLRKRKSDEIQADQLPMMPMFPTMPIPAPMTTIVPPQPPIPDQAQKKAKFSPVFSEFNKKLEQLATMRERLSETDRRMANEFSLEKLLSIDPEFTIDFFLKNDLQSGMGMNLANGGALANMLQGLVQQHAQASSSTQQQQDINNSEFLNSDKFDSGV